MRLKIQKALHEESFLIIEEYLVERLCHGIEKLHFFWYRDLFGV